MSLNRKPVLGSLERRSVARAALGLAIGAVVVAVVGQALLSSTPPGPTSSPGIAVSSPARSDALGPSASPEAAWSDLEVPPFAARADLVPADVDSLGVAASTTFTLVSRSETPAVALAAGLAARPAVDFTIKAGADATQAVIKPKHALQEGARYSFQLTAPDGSLAGTWLFTARQPLHVVSILPDDRSVDVPTNTGIELTFDQDGVKGVADHVSIQPPVDGRFEAHGRTWAFVPAKRLEPRTVYTVTAQAGIGVAGSTETLETAVRFRFETGSAEAAPPHLRFGRPIVEVRPNVEPIVTMTVSDEEGSVPRTVAIDVYSIPSLAAATSAARTLTGDLGWALSSPDAIVSTKDLSRVDRVDAELIDSDGSRVARIPVHLRAGWYLLHVDQATGPTQLLLQVTDIGAFAFVTSKSTVVWVNDLGADSPVGGATVRVASGTALGTTAPNGVMEAATPDGLAATATEEQEGVATLLTVRTADGRAMIVALGMRWDWLYDLGLNSEDGRYDRFWHAFMSDRAGYRQTDNIHVSGFVRTRADGTVPDGVSVQLVPDGESGTPILTQAVTPSARGSFLADIALVDMPRSAYNLQLVVDHAVVASLWINVTEIRKPSYRIDVETERAAYVAGDRVRISSTTSFFDDTPVPGLDVRFTGFGGSTKVTTDAAGLAATRLQASSSDGFGWSIEEIGARPARPEEGQISGTNSVVVFPSRVWLSGTGRVHAGNVVADGRLAWVDLDRVDAAWRDGQYPDDPSGEPIVGGAVTAKVIRHVVTQTQVGTRYDFIEKKVVPVYESNYADRTIGTYALTSTRNGGFHLSVPAPDADGWYTVEVSAKDPEGRVQRQSIEADSRDESSSNDGRPYLTAGGGCGYAPAMTVGLGATASVTMHDSDGTVASGGRFLYVVSHGGTVEVVTQDGPTFERVLRDADLPGFNIYGVRLSAAGFEAAEARAEVDANDKRIEVILKPDARRYRPGDVVTVDVTTTGADGEPIAADVILDGVDEKFFRMGLAREVDPLEELLAPISPQLRFTFSSHALPRPGGDGCGDTGGEDDRTDFRDTVTFQRVTTDAAGHASATFKLSHDLTSWHINATAYSKNLDAGRGSVEIPVGLPFFAEAVLAPEYLVGDHPVLRVTGYGERLAAGDPVRFTVTSDSLGVSTTAAGTAFAAVRVPLPILPAGEHRITITAVASHDGRTLRDTLVRRVRVVSTRIGTLETRVDALDPSFSPTGGDGLTTYVIADAGRGSLIALLESLAWGSGPRFDRSAAADVARQLLIDDFAMDPVGLPASGYDSARYEREGIALLPYSSADLELTALAAATVPTRVDMARAQAYLQGILESADVTRERTIVALAGQAAAGGDVAQRLRAYDESSLTIREQLWLAIGLAGAGDDAAARTIERDLLERYGERLGPWARLRVGSDLEDTLEGSSLLLVLAARLADPLADDVARYLVANESKERVMALPLVSYAGWALARLPRDVGAFAYTIGGTRKTVTLERGGSFTLTLTAAQRATLRLEPLVGRLSVATSWVGTGGVLPSDPNLTVTRTVSPEEGSADGRLVRVTLEVAFGKQMPSGCYELTDLLPSGLAPVVATAGWVDEEEDDENARIANAPYVVEGQLVSWCTSPGDPSHTFKYSARVVSPGTYRWEPAVIQSVTAPSLGNATAEGSFTVR